MDIMIMDERDRKRLWDLQKPLRDLAREAEKKRGVCIYLMPRTKEQINGFAEWRERELAYIETLAEIHAAAVAIMKDFTPNFPLVPIAEATT